MQNPAPFCEGLIRPAFTIFRAPYKPVPVGISDLRKPYQNQERGWCGLAESNCLGSVARRCPLPNAACCHTDAVAAEG
nr:MAG TPA: hypothetical protein [Caudoviricetes sp.]